MPFATNAGVRAHWQEQGEGTPLLLIMGHRFSGEMWWPVLPAVTPPRLSAIADAGHNYLIADIDGINHEVVEFLAGVDGAANA